MNPTKKKIYIAAVNLFREGVKDNRAWKLWHVVDQQGLQYGTFEAKYGGMIGQEVEVLVEEKPSDKINPNTGNPYINRNIIEPKRSDANVSVILSELKRLENLINDIPGRVIALFAEQDNEPASPDGGPDETGDPQDLGF